MAETTSQKLLRALKEYGIMTLGMWIYAFAWSSIILPARCTGGGASGLAMMIYYASGGTVELGTTVFLINAVLIVVASFIVGWKFSTKTIFSIIMLSVAMNILQANLPADIMQLGEERLLSSILGGILSGIGVSLCLLQGGTSGGTDIVALIVNKYRTISYGRILFITDFIIIGSSLLVTRDIQMVIFGYVVVAACGYTADAVLAGDKKSSQLMIMSKHYEAIADAIVNDLHRGCTVMDGTGWFTKEATKVVMVLCRKSETSTILRTVKRVDPNAFISNASVTGVYGRGFEEIKR